MIINDKVKALTRFDDPIIMFFKAVVIYSGVICHFNHFGVPRGTTATALDVRLDDGLAMSNDTKKNEYFVHIWMIGRYLRLRTFEK